jgi:hypothetical protein
VTIAVVAALDTVLMSTGQRETRNVLGDELEQLRQYLTALHRSVELHDGTFLYMELDAQIVGHQVVTKVHHLRPAGGSFWGRELPGWG